MKRVELPRRSSSARVVIRVGCFRTLPVALLLLGSARAMADTPPLATAEAPAPPAPAAVLVPVDTAATPPAPHVTPQKAKAVASAPPANATLHVTPGALGTPWTFEVTNYDDTPLRIVTDGRLLSLDLTSDDDDDDDSHPHHGKRAAVHCALPSELLPVTDSDRVHILGPAVTYVEVFDPRMYCFDGREAAALTPDAKLAAHLGWRTSHTSTPPFVADQTLTGHERSGVKELTAEAVTVPDTISSDPPAEHRHALTVRAPSHIDAESGRDLVIEVSAENTTTRPIHLMLRPETLAFEVSSSKGVRACTGKTHPASPIAEVFTTIPPHGRASTSVLLSTICPDATFQSAGLYTVEARIDTRHASGKAIGLDTFDGVVRAGEPTLVRIRRDRARRP